MTTVFMEKLESGDVIELGRDGDCVTALVLLAADEAVILDLCDGSTPFVAQARRARRVSQVRARRCDRLTPDRRSPPRSAGRRGLHGAQPVFRVGGMPFFERLVDAFYARRGDRRRAAAALPGGSRSHRRPAPADAVPRPVLGRATHVRRRARATRCCGCATCRSGSARWSATAGCANMAAAVGEVCADLPDSTVADELMTYFVTTAEHMRNDTGLPITSASFGER